jgi:hypothetical protein
MNKLVLLFTFIFLSCIGVNCKDNPIPPCSDCPQKADTTSHDFTWQTDAFGDYGSSHFNDIVVINDTLAYAVGLVHIYDSTGHIDYNDYNAARWTGKKWELLRIPVLSGGDDGSTGSFELNAAFGFNANDIWFAGNGELIHWDGTRSTSKAIFATEFPFYGQIRRIWGANANDIYCVGGTGSIFHFTGTSWVKIATGTTLPIMDIWGSKNSLTGATEILALASDMFSTVDSKLLRINNNIVMALADTGLSWGLSSIWFEADNKYYIGGAGIFTGNPSSPALPWRKLDSSPRYYTTDIRGSGINDIVAAGVDGSLFHYNGSTWSDFSETGLSLFNGIYFGVSIKSNVICAVGEIGNRAVLSIGKRYKY